jgi:hypothetical protein
VLNNLKLKGIISNPEKIKNKENKENSKNKKESSRNRKERRKILC